MVTVVVVSPLADAGVEVKGSTAWMLLIAIMVSSELPGNVLICTLVSPLQMTDSHQHNKLVE